MTTDALLRVCRFACVILLLPSEIFGNGLAGTDEACEASLLQTRDATRHSRKDRSPCDAFLQSISNEMQLPELGYTASGTHFAQGYTTQNASNVSVQGMEEDCDNINLNKKLSANFRSDVFGPGMKGFFYKCKKVGDQNKYWFTITSASESNMKELCDPETQFPIVYDEQHSTYWKDFPFTCDTEPAKNTHGYIFLDSVSDEMQLTPGGTTASGTHFAQGYMTLNASEISVEGMREDCDNINLNKKLSANFRPDVFGPGMKGFFYECVKVSAINKYWFTITSASTSNMKKLCNPETSFPIVYDEQHSTYWQDLPFACV